MTIVYDVLLQTFHLIISAMCANICAVATTTTTMTSNDGWVWGVGGGRWLLGYETRSGTLISRIFLFAALWTICLCLVWFISHPYTNGKYTLQASWRVTANFFAISIHFISDAEVHSIHNIEDRRLLQTLCANVVVVGGCSRMEFVANGVWSHACKLAWRLFRYYLSAN